MEMSRQPIGPPRQEPGWEHRCVRYRVTHSTKYEYSEPVSVCHNVVHLTPRNLAHQQCESTRLLISPQPSDRSRRVDYFGNQTEYFAIQDAHLGLTITANSQLELRPRDLPGPGETVAWNALAEQLKSDRRAWLLSAYQFAFPSQYAPLSSTYRQYAQPSFPPGRPILEAARELAHRIHQDFQYDPSSTTLSTTLDECFERRAGVCQDFAHVQIACLRSLGLAARYVSGYLRTVSPEGMPRLIGSDASHAWAGVYCGDAGWVELDPTNNVFVDTDHITVAWGRDYGDVCPIQGVAIGGGQHRMSVSVDVSELG